MDIPHNITTEIARDTQKVGEEIGRTLVNGKGRVPRVFCLWGELGSGKTTFVQGLARGMGITSRLLSPTFIIVRRYDIPGGSDTLYHLDLYRMKTKQDVEAIGFADMLADPAGFVVVEWPERLGALLPAKRVDMRFTVLESGAHEIIIEDHT